MKTVYLVLSAATQQPVDVFLTKEEAEKMIEAYELDDAFAGNSTPNNYSISTHNL